MKDLQLQKDWKEIEKQIAPILLSGGVGVLPTDTLYGLVGSARDKKAIERIYKLRKRDLKKPMIILIASLLEIEKFGVKLDSEQKKILKKIWPAKVSVILPCLDKNFKYLTRGGKTLAFRMPSDEYLIKFLKKSGPLVAPSANLAGESAAKTFEDAKKYFGNKIDFYVDFGELNQEPSTLVELKENKLKVLRQGAVKIK